MHKFTKALAAIGLAAVMSQSAMAENLKLGFLVKQPEEPWFQTEWKFADKAGKDLGFEVIKIAVPDGEKTLKDTVQEALEQIERKQYAALFVSRGIPKEHIRSYGFAFQGKQVLIG